jgi:nucleotide-binding universal stress UspA family protein
MMEGGVIVVALDLSLSDPPLLEAAKAQARAFSAELYLVHVVAAAPDFVGLPRQAEAAQATPATEEVGVGYAYDRQVAAERIKVARADLEQLRERVEADGLRVAAILIEGAPAEKIVDEVERRGAGLIVVGSHQRHTIGELLHGSVSRDVLRRAPCPVLVVPTHRGA